MKTCVKVAYIISSYMLVRAVYLAKEALRKLTEQALVASVYTLLRHNANSSQPAIVLGQMSKTVSETISLKDPQLQAYTHS